MPPRGDRSPASSDNDSEPDDAPTRLAALDRLLAASLFAPAASPSSPPAFAEERPRKKRKKQEEPQAAEPVPAHPKEQEVVSFRLFSTSKAPTRVVLHEKEEWEVVVDPRIRDVDDEPVATVEQREKNVASVVVTGAQVRCQALLEPNHPQATRQASKRKLVKDLSAVTLPRILYLNAVLPVPPPATSTKPAAKRSTKTPQQLLRNPWERRPHASLDAVPILKGDVVPRRSLSTPSKLPKKRVSKVRRAAMRRKKATP